MFARLMVASWPNGGAPFPAPAFPTNRFDLQIVALGGQHGVAVTDSGSLITWGTQGGKPSYVPIDITNVVALAAGSDHTFALQADGIATWWGPFVNGGIRRVGNVKMVASGAFHALMLFKDGTIFEYGYDPGPGIPYPKGLSNVISIGAGFYHSLAVMDDGTVRAWGRNEYSQCNVPPGLSNVVAVAGGSHSVALKSDGTVVCWGGGPPESVLPPKGLSNVIAIAAGIDYTIALRADGTIVGWGQNGWNQLSFPPGLHAVRSISASGFASAAVTAAPVIASQPQDVVVSAGETPRFSVAAYGHEPLSYQWAFQGEPLLHETNSSLTVPIVQLAHAGNYSVIVGADSASITSKVVTLVVKDSPNVRTGDSVVALLDDSASLRVDAFGTPPLSIQWFKGTNAVRGATSARLTYTGLQFSHEATYYATVSNAFGFVKSAPMFLTVLNRRADMAWGPPGTPTGLPSDFHNIRSIAMSYNTGLALYADGTVGWWPVPPYGTQPYAPLGAPAGLSHILQMALGGSHGLALDEAGKVTAWGTALSQMPEITERVISIAAGPYHSAIVLEAGRVLTWADGGSLKVPPGAAGAISVAAGNNYTAAVKSDGTVLAWNLDGALRYVPPGLSNVISVAAGHEQTLALKSDGIVVAWNSTGPSEVPDSLTNVVQIASGISQNLALTSEGSIVEWGNTGRGSVIRGLNHIRGIVAGDVFSAALLDSPLFITQPENVRVREGQNATFRVVAEATTNSGLISLQWFHNNLAIDRATNSEFSIKGVQLQDGGDYVLSASNEAGTSSTYANLAILSPPNVAGQLHDLEVALGDHAFFEIHPTGSDPTGFQWYHNGVPINRGDYFLGFESVTSADLGTYFVVVTNEIGVAVSESVTLRAGEPPSILIQPQDQRTTAPNEILLIGGVAASEAVSYQWFQNDDPILGATQSFLFRPFSAIEDSGYYSFTASNRFGTVRSRTARLIVQRLDGVFPDLEVQIANGKIKVTWPESLERYVLQATTNLNYSWMGWTFSVRFQSRWRGWKGVGISFFFRRRALQDFSGFVGDDRLRVKIKPTAFNFL